MLHYFSFPFILFAFAFATFTQPAKAENSFDALTERVVQELDGLLNESSTKLSLKNLTSNAKDHLKSFFSIEQMSPETKKFLDIVEEELRGLGTDLEIKDATFHSNFSNLPKQDPNEALAINITNVSSLTDPKAYCEAYGRDRIHYNIPNAIGDKIQVACNTLTRRLQGTTTTLQSECQSLITKAAKRQSYHTTLKWNTTEENIDTEEAITKVLHALFEANDGTVLAKLGPHARRRLHKSHPLDAVRIDSYVQQVRSGLALVEEALAVKRDNVQSILEGGWDNSAKIKSLSARIAQLKTTTELLQKMVDSMSCETQHELGFFLYLNATFPNMTLFCETIGLTISTNFSVSVDALSDSAPKESFFHSDGKPTFLASKSGQVCERRGHAAQTAKTTLTELLPYLVNATNTTEAEPGTSNSSTTLAEEQVDENTTSTTLAEEQVDEMEAPALDRMKVMDEKVTNIEQKVTDLLDQALVEEALDRMKVMDETVTSIDEKVTNLDEKVTNLAPQFEEEKVTDLLDRMQAMDEKVTNIEQKVTNLAPQFEEEKVTDLLDRMQAMDEKVTNIDEKVTNLAPQFEEEKVTDLLDRMQAMDEKVTNIDEKVTNLAPQFEEEKVTDLLDRMQAMDEKVTNIDEKVTNLAPQFEEEKVTDLLDRMQAMDEKVTNIDQKVTNLAPQVEEALNQQNICLSQVLPHQEPPAPTSNEPAPEPTEAPTSNEPAPEPTEAPTSNEPAPEPTEAPTSNEPAPEPTEAPTSNEPAPEPPEAPTSNEPAPEPTEAPTSNEPAPHTYGLIWYPIAVMCVLLCICVWYRKVTSATDDASESSSENSATRIDTDWYERLDKRRYEALSKPRLHTMLAHRGINMNVKKSKPRMLRRFIGSHYNELTKLTTLDVMARVHGAGMVTVTWNKEELIDEYLTAGCPPVIEQRQLRGRP